MDKLTRFLKEVKHELAKVSWPTKGQVIQYTVVVVAISLVVAVFLGVLDLVFEWALNKII